MYELLDEEQKESIRILLGYSPVSMGGPELPNLDKGLPYDGWVAVTAILEDIKSIDQDLKAIRQDCLVERIEDLALNFANQHRLLTADRKSLIKRLSAYLDIPIAGRRSARQGLTAVQYQ